MLLLRRAGGHPRSTAACLRSAGSARGLASESLQLLKKSQAAAKMQRELISDEDHSIKVGSPMRPA